MVNHNEVNVFVKKDVLVHPKVEDVFGYDVPMNEGWASVSLPSQTSIAIRRCVW